MHRRYACFAVLLVFCSCKSGSRPEASPNLRRMNLLLVTIDTLRADRVGPLMPNLTRLAAGGALFANAVCQAPLTAPSHASMMTGLYPTAHKVRDTGGFVLQSSDTTLAQILAGQGWDTAAFVGASVLKKRFGFSHGFNLYDDQMPTPDAAERRADEVVDRAAGWLGSQSGKPFFLWVHVYDPHLPYAPPAGFPQTYDGEVAYTDQQLGRLFAAAAARENTLIAVLSDHGEALSEHGEYAHGVFLYDTTVRIAFVLKGPGVPPGVRVNSQARTVDLVPTILDLMGGKAPQTVQGTSLVPALSGKPVNTEYSYTETLFPKLNMGWTELRALRTDRWKYILAPKPELYDLAADPGEANNVIAAHASEAKQLEGKLKEIAVTITEKVEPAQVDQRTVAQLKSLGYLGGSSQQPYVLTGKGIDPKDRTGVLKLLHEGVHGNLPAARRIALLRDAIEQDPTNPSLYSNLGDVYRQEGREGEALKLYESAINRGVRAAWLDTRLGQLYLKQGKRDEAILFLERAAQQNPSDLNSLENLAVAYRESGKLDDAERVCKWILQSGEDYAPGYNELGMIAYQKGDRAAARGYFEKAAQLDPTYHLNLGRLYKMAGEKDRARASFQAFLAARGSSPQYRGVAAEAQRELADVK